MDNAGAIKPHPFIPPRTQSAPGTVPLASGAWRPQRLQAHPPPREDSPEPEGGGSPPPPVPAAATSVEVQPRPAAMERPESPKTDVSDAGSPTEELPRLIYSRKTMFSLSHYTDLQSTKLQNLASEIRPPPEARPSDPRGGVFADTTSKRKDRSLKNHVLGIMCKLTPDNYERLQHNLADLPVRQSTDEELTEVVNLIYTKAVRPEDEIYAPLYARLVSDLVRMTSEVRSIVQPSSPTVRKSHVGNTIRKALVDQCQERFDQPFELNEEMLVGVGNEEAEARRTSHRRTMRSNIKFLGYLMTNGLVIEKVVTNVLYELLYGPLMEHKARKKPTEFEVEMFCDLLKKSVGSLSPKSYEDFIPGWMLTINGLTSSRSYSNRIKFMLMDLVDLQKAGWVDRRGGPGVMRLDDLNRAQEEEQARQSRTIHNVTDQRSSGLGQQRRPVEQAPQMPAKEDMYALVEKSAPSQIENFFQQLRAAEVRRDYLFAYVDRATKGTRLSKERGFLHEMLSTVVGAKLMNAEDVETVFVRVADHAATKDIFEDHPKFFEHWAEAVAAAGSFVSPRVHTLLLQRLLDPSNHIKLCDVVKMIAAVLGCPRRLTGDEEATRRFRLLPSVLQHTAIDLRAPAAAANAEAREVGEEKREAHESGEKKMEDDDSDLFDYIVSHADKDEGCARIRNDPEMYVFCELFEGSDKGPKVEDLRTRFPDRDATMVLKVASAVFTFMRCEAGEATPEWRTRGSKLFRGIMEHQGKEMQLTVLKEIFLTWRALGRIPQYSLRRFVNKVRGDCSFTNDAVNSFSTWIRQHYPDDHEKDCIDFSVAQARLPAPASAGRR